MTLINIEGAKEIIKKSNKIVFFGGAGVSTASGIPDFRSSTGLYNKKNNSTYSPEYILSHDFFVDFPKEFCTYVKENLIYEDVKPNKAHNILKKLEENKQLLGIITQNIDSLHQKSGSKQISELHGNLRDYYCVKCNKKYDLKYYTSSKDLVVCNSCNGIVRPNVVLYGENLPEKEINKAIYWLENADLLIIGGTSLSVYPAAGFLKYYNKENIILINKEKTDLDYLASYVFREDIGSILEKIIE